MYAIMKKDTKEVLCETTPNDYKVTNYFAPTFFNPYTGCKCLGSIKLFDCKEKAVKQAEKELDCFVVGVESGTFRIFKLTNKY